MIFYKLIQNKNEEMPKAFNKWYARPVVTETIDLDYIAERIQRNSTAKKSDAKAVLTEMVEVITDALLSSQRVKIDGFGAFKVGISSRGADSEEDYSTAEHVRGVRIIFQPETQTDPSTRKRSKKMLVGATLSNISGLVAKKEQEP
ncbi:MAG: HU family DNA-binding protein [Prevotella sp.]|nr:HU family DNA-binding protein [Prevotella sp.]